jgi:cytochrome c1
MAGADPERGREVITAAACGVCHVIPGVRGARGHVGPPLTQFGLRSYIAGNLPNTPENLVVWILDPQKVEPQTAMPSVGLDEAQARDVAAYLHQLR